ncbi:MAG: c-type cytochrome [Candidatus Tectomicrobia bacterium]|uniref:C-type cytochrome n=1 Tax=Tectimicrobiota bacterium TaxID=2528274 RepID=A0A932CPL6_UNCTE|nr:c-type cytochrome [Candidatus Tectomicrobia bacterium]
MKKGFCGLLVASLLWTSSCMQKENGYPAGAPAGSPAMAPGEKIFLEKCAPCHGRTGKGDGPVASALNPRPHDLTSGKFKYGGSRKEIARVIRQGIPGTSMTRWDTQLPREQIEVVADYVRSLAKTGMAK